MDQVLEHPKDPAAYLREANRLLSDQGVLFIGCPNIGSFSNRWKTWLGQKGLKRRRRGNHYGTFHHMFFYTPGILAKVLEQHGFSISHIQGRPSPNLTNPLARRLQTTLYTWMPWLDSTFQIVATKQRSLVMGEPSSIHPANANSWEPESRDTTRRAA